MMSIDTVQALTDKAAEYSKQAGTKFSFVWHGGEPLLRGRNFYEKARALQVKADDSFVLNNILQTNGVLVSDDYARSLVEHGYSVGVSIDGPPIIHDKQRQMPGDKSGSFMTAYEALSEAEDDTFRQSCKSRNLRPADYLRECCLAVAYLPVSVDKISMVADIFHQLHGLEDRAGKMQAQLSQTGNNDKAADASKIVTGIVVVRKKLKTVLYTGGLVIAASVAHVYGEEDWDISKLTALLRFDVYVLVVLALLMGFCIGFLMGIFGEKRAQKKGSTLTNW